MQVAGMAPKKERKPKKEKDIGLLSDGKVKFADRLKALIKTGAEVSIEEPLSVDDPYVFHESLSEMNQDKSSTPGSDGSSPKAMAVDPVAKTPPQPVVIKSEPGKLLANVSCPPTESKPKSAAAKTSKTMNRLQAKIAQNKILDKLKKNQESSLNPGCISCHPDMNFVLKTESAHSTTTENVNGVKESSMLLPVALGGSANNGVTCVYPVANSGSSRLSPMLNCTNIKLEPPDRPETPNLDSKSTHLAGTVNIQPYKLRNRSSLRIPGLLRHVQTNWESRKSLKADLYPLGTELSDTDGEESDSEPVQRHWFYSWDKSNFQVNTSTQTSCRVAKLSSRQCEMRRSYNQMCKSHTVGESYKPHSRFISSLIQAARQYPSKTADVLQNLRCGSTKPKRILKSTGLIKRYCCYRNDKDICESVALPFTRHCLKHITYNVDQLLFEHCTAKFADNTQCCVPVFDICHELPLCAEHARKRDNYNKMSAEPKPKKPRKKTKPSALTRPPKRGKKKKKQNGIRPNKLPVPAIQSNIETASTDSPASNPCMDTSDHMSPGPTELHAEDIAKDLDDHLDSDLGNDLEGTLSPGSIEKSLELPLDTAELANQATRLLEEHDFTEVLNKIPDDAFNDLFTESKNGEFLPTKEETEELERALAAVDKDVKSLEKLSVENNDINELASSMDIHNSLLNSENLAHAMDDSTLSELTQGNINMDNLNVITSSLTTNDLNSISQVLSNITTDTLVPNSLPANLVDGAILQNHLSGVHLLPELVQGQLQLQVPVGATQATNFVLSPQLLGATFSTDGTTSAGNFSNGSTIPTIAAGTFPQTLTQTIPLATTPDGISISLQSQLQGIRAGQWILSPAEPTFTPMLYQNGFPLSTQSFAQQVSTIGNLKFPFQAAVDVLKQAPQEQEILNTVDQTQTFSTTVNGNPLSTGSALASAASLTNAFPVQSTDSPKETVS